MTAAPAGTAVSFFDKKRALSENRKNSLASGELRPHSLRWLGDLRPQTPDRFPHCGASVRIDVAKKNRVLVSPPLLTKSWLRP